MTALEVYVVGLAYKGLQIYVRWSLLRLVVVCPVVKKVSSVSYVLPTCPERKGNKSRGHRSGFASIPDGPHPPLLFTVAANNTRCLLF